VRSDSPVPVGEQARGRHADKSSRGWFVAETLPRKEQVARGNLKRQDFESLCPFFRKLRRHARKQDVVLAPLCPGYIFVSFDKLVDGWHAINATRGVKRLTCAARGEPQARPCGCSVAPLPTGSPMFTGSMTRGAFGSCLISSEAPRR